MGDRGRWPVASKGGYGAAMAKVAPGWRARRAARRAGEVGLTGSRGPDLPAVAVHAGELAGVAVVVVDGAQGARTVDGAAVAPRAALPAPWWRRRPPAADAGPHESTADPTLQRGIVTLEPHRRAPSVALATVPDAGPLAPAPVIEHGHVDAARLYIASLPSPRSRQTALESLRRLARALDVAAPGERDAWARIPWGHLTARETSLVQRVLLEQHRPATARLTMSILRGILKQAWRLGYMNAEAYQAAKDTAAINASRIPTGRMLSLAEFETLTAYVDAMPMPYGAMVSAILACAVAGGLRRQELAQLPAKALEQHGDEMRVIGKGDKERPVPLDPAAVTEIQRWLAERDKLGLACETMFVRFGRDGKAKDQPMTGWQVYDVITDAGRKAGLKPFTPHDLRRTFGSTLLDTVDIGTVRGMMGHESVTTTMIYDKRDDRAAKQACRIFGPWFRRKIAPPPPEHPPETNIDASTMPLDVFYANDDGKPLVRRTKAP
jgi:integrase